MNKINYDSILTTNEFEFDKLHVIFFDNDITWFSLNGVDVYIRIAHTDANNYKLIIGLSSNPFKANYRGKIYLLDIKAKPTIPGFEYTIPNKKMEKYYQQIKQLLSSYHDCSSGKRHQTIKHIVQDLDFAYNNGYIK